MSNISLIYPVVAVLVLVVAVLHENVELVSSVVVDTSSVGAQLSIFGAKSKRRREFPESCKWCSIQRQ